MKVSLYDIKKLLKSKGYEWNGYIYDGNIGRHRLATEEDFKGQYNQVRLLVKTEEYEGNISFIINAVRFCRIGYYQFPMDSYIAEDWSNDWRKQLLETTPGYAKFLSEWVKTSKKEANNDYKKSKQAYTNNLNEAKSRKNTKLEALKVVEDMIKESQDDLSL